MQQVRKWSADQYARTLLQTLYYYAKFLAVIDCRFDKNQLKVYHVHRSGKCIIRTVRLLLILTFSSAIDKLFKQYNISDLTHTSSYIEFFARLQIVSVAIFANFVFIVQTCCEKQIIHILNAYLQLYERIIERCKRQTIMINTVMGHGMLSRKFMAIFLLKIATTLIGYVKEWPALLQVEDLLNNGLINFVASFVGVYLWMGSMFMLDVCVLGLLIIALMYEEMGKFLKRMLSRMSLFEEIEIINKNRRNMRKGHSKIRFSNYKCMKLLCDRADVIADCDVIYAELYELTKKFLHLFQWKIFYYIYYNFMVILLGFHNCIWMYLHLNVLDRLGFLMVAVKIVNLGVLIMCADFAVKCSRMPQLLCLDIICSDIDERWDLTVEEFLSRRQTERMQIKVLGFFQLNNEFILLILSAIVSYLFIIIQFGLNNMK